MSERVYRGVVALMVMVTLAGAWSRWEVAAGAQVAGADAEVCASPAGGSRLLHLRRDILYRDVNARLGGEFDILATWCRADLETLKAWLDLGLRLEGTWTSKELCLVLNILEAAGARLSRERFAALARTAVVDPSGGARSYLTFRRSAETTAPPAGWLNRQGTVVLKDALFDRRAMDRDYRWPFLDRCYGDPIPADAITQVAIAHELGHVIADGLRAEWAAAAGGAAAAGAALDLDARYMATVSARFWPHTCCPANESLATEIGLWLLDLERPADVLDFRATYLAPMADGPDWPRRFGPDLAMAPAPASH